jgi:hypothetical protein
MKRYWKISILGALTTCLLAILVNGSLGPAALAEGPASITPAPLGEVAIDADVAEELEAAGGLPIFSTLPDLTGACTTRSATTLTPQELAEITAYEIYFSDFEADDGGLTGSRDWEWGEFTWTGVGCESDNFPPAFAYSGTQMWGTVLNTCYNNLGNNSGYDSCLNSAPGDDSILSFTVDLTGFTDASLSWWEWFDLFMPWDWIEVYANGEVVFQHCGGTFVQPTTWEQQTVDLTPYVGGPVAIEFHMLASTVVNHAGWYIDNLLVASSNPQFAVTPTQLQAELCPDQFVIHPLQICNEGGAPLQWAIDPPDVLLLFADDDSLSNSPIQTTLRSFGDLGKLDLFDAKAATPTLAQLLGYDVILTWSNYEYSDPVGIGDVLADYVDSGGKVINLMFSMGSAGWQMEGRFMDEGYSAMDGSTLDYSNICLGIYDSLHPIMEGVTNVCDNYHVQGTSLTMNAHEVAQWADGNLFVAAKDDRSVVSINGYVGLVNSWTGQMDEVVHNAILWLSTDPLADIPWLSVDLSSGLVPAGECQEVEVSYDSTGKLPGDYVEDIAIWSNDPETPQVIVPFAMKVYDSAEILGISYTVNDLTVTFTADITGTAPTAYLWTFGDLSTSTLPGPSHTYAAYGCYPVTLDITSCEIDSWAGEVCLIQPVNYLYLPLHSR